MDFVANFSLNKNDLEANFELNQPVQFDALFEINPAGTSWGNITGTLADQTDLQNALNLKADKTELDADVELLNQTITEAYNTLDNKIDDVNSDLSGDISALTQTVENNNTAINSRVDGIVDSFDADIEEINTDISNLETTVSDNYTDLNTKIQNEATTRAENDSLLQGDINTLNTNLTAEINNRATADSGLQTQINSVKQTADSAIQPNDNITLLNNNAGYITSADLPTLEDLTTQAQLDAINSGATTSKIGQIATNTSNISSLTTTVTNNYNTLDGRITSEVSALNTAIGAETTNRQNADNALQSQIDAIVSSSDVFDIVGTYAELQAYDISTVPVNDIIKVLVDSTHNNAATYYRCTETNNVKSWTYIGAEGAYYTKSEADNKFVEQTTTVNNKPLSNNITLTASDVGALPSSIVIGSGVLTIQKNGSDVDTFSANATSNKSINITVPTKTSDLTNDSNFATVSQIPTNNNQLTNGAGYITSSALSGYATENFVTSQGYITGISGSDVTTALGYTPYNSTNPNNYISGINDTMVVNALGYTPVNPASLATVATSGSYNDLSNKPTIPSAVTESTVSGWGFTKNVGTVTSVNNTQPVNGNVTINIPDTSTLANKDLSNLSSTGEAKFQTPLVSGTNIKTVNNTSLLGSGNVAVQPTLVSGTNIKTINSTSLLGSGNIDTSEVFIAEYGVTSFADIQTAYNAGKVVFCKYNNFLYVLQQFMAGDEAIFTAIDLSTSYRIECILNVGWNTVPSRTLEQTSRKVTSISIASTDTQYPSAKCVYDELTNKADTDLSNLSATGQKVIDGQWVQSFINLINSGGTIDGVQLYLSFYLPNDGYNYEVKFKIYAYDNDSTYSYYLNTDIFNNGQTTTSVENVYSQVFGGTYSRQNTNIFDLPVGTGRYIKLYGSGADEIMVYALGYRRLGTNS